MKPSFPIVRTDELSEGQTISFHFVRAGKKVSAFVARFQGQYLAYENVCRHLPVSLDYGDDRFFTRDGRHFLCQTHGAIYEPISGLCVRGPCEGDSLEKLSIELRDGVIHLVEDNVERMLNQKQFGK